MLLFALLLAGASATMISDQTHRAEHVGQCFHPRVKQVLTRLVDGDGAPILSSGSAMTFTDHHYVVSYDNEPGLESARPGDPVRLCVVAIPQHCPAGDNRGIRYRITNLRTHRTVRMLPDSEHGCGGA